VPRKSINFHDERVKKMSLFGFFFALTFARIPLRANYSAHKSIMIIIIRVYCAQLTAIVNLNIYCILTSLARDLKQILRTVGKFI